MPRVALLVEYTGRKFHGSQFQLGVRTVQEELEKALSVFFRLPIRAIFAGRTDAGVHAAGMVVHFDVPEFDGDFYRLLWALNGILPADLAAYDGQLVAEHFHSRFSANQREYVYRILNRSQRSALLDANHYFVNAGSLDVERMEEAAVRLLGTHDFTSFRASNSDKTSPLCRIERVQMLRIGEGQLEFWIGANHFVYNMVRIIVGTLVEIGLSKRTPESFAEALSGQDRNLSGPTAPAWGLTLQKVRYPEEFSLFKKS
ncbi:MAG: tRNA pseudouridine(38-40) synthase TruA [Leptolyngbya sp.]|nr:tRNA pseudouridine(38-40) synthase TruA [Candidatus Melainabacteria bacterium]